MNRSKLRDKFLKNRNEESKKRFNCQRNLCVSLLCKPKRRFSGKLEHKVFSGSWSILRIIGPLFLEKAFGKEYIILNNNNKTIRNNEKLAKIFQ